MASQWSRTSLTAAGIAPLRRISASRPALLNPSWRRPAVRQSCCLLVVLVFAARAGVGSLLPDAVQAADPVCECEFESLTEEIESDHDAVDGLVGCVCRGILLNLAPAVTPLPASPRLTAVNLAHLRPPLLRGPPA